MAGETDPSQHLSHTLRTHAGSSVDIPFALFSNEDDRTLDPSLITTIYIAFIQANNESTEFDFSIENIRFKNTEKSYLSFDPNKLNLYPNPTSEVVNITHKFAENSDVVISVYDTKGTLVQQKNVSAYKGIQSFELNFNKLEQGVYIISLYANEGVFTSKLLLGR